MVINREDLLDIIKEKCKGKKYFVGLHGANASKFSHVSNDEVLKRIEEDGLISKRSLTGTIAFFGRGDIISNDSKNKRKFDNYNYCNTQYYAILVFPAYIKMNDGREIFIGSTNLDSKYSKYFDSHGYQTTSLADLAYKNHIIDKRFVFGTFKKLDNQNIELHLNPNFINSNEFDSDILYKIFNSYISRRVLKENKLDRLLHLGLSQEEKQELEKIQLKLLYELDTSDNKHLIKEVCVPILETINQLLLEEKREIKYVTTKLQLLKDDYYKVFDDVMSDVDFFKYGLRQLNNIQDEELRESFRIHFLYSSDPKIFTDPELINLALKNKINIVDRISLEVDEEKTDETNMRRI